jgi:hypothetical protein
VALPGMPSGETICEQLCHLVASPETNSYGYRFTVNKVHLLYKPECATARVRKFTEEKSCKSLSVDVLIPKVLSEDFKLLMTADRRCPGLLEYFSSNFGLQFDNARFYSQCLSRYLHILP